MGFGWEPRDQVQAGSGMMELQVEYVQVETQNFLLKLDISKKPKNLIDTKSTRFLLNYEFLVTFFDWHNGQPNNYNGNQNCLEVTKY